MFLKQPHTLLTCEGERWLRCIMESDSEKHHRRSIRLKGYDYSRSGAYFITICTQKHLCSFGDIVDGIMAFNQAGRMIKRMFEEMPAKYTGVQTDVFVIMPNNLHGIIKIENTSSVGAAPCGRLLSLSNETANCLTDDIDKGQIDKKRKQYEGQPRGVAPTDKKLVSNSSTERLQRDSKC